LKVDIFNTKLPQVTIWDGHNMLKRVSLLSAVALAGFLYVSGAQGAFAGPVVVPPAQALTSSPHSSSVDAYYNYHGHHYAYRDHGRYYNHRSYHNGHWRYY
jgi:hypothetical protein